MKLIGGLLVILGSGLGGMIIANALQARGRELQQFLRALNLLITEIEFGMHPLEIAFRRVSQSLHNPVGDFFWTVAERMRQCGSAGTAWLESIKIIRPSMSCTCEDWAALEELAASLGQLDKENQIKSVRLLIARMEGHLQDAQRSAATNDRIYRYSGFALGMILVLIFL